MLLESIFVEGPLTTRATFPCGCGWLFIELRRHGLSAIFRGSGHEVRRLVKVVENGWLDLMLVATSWRASKTKAESFGSNFMAFLRIRTCLWGEVG